MFYALFFEVVEYCFDYCWHVCCSAWSILGSSWGSARSISVVWWVWSLFVIRMVFLWRIWKMLIGRGWCGICIQFSSGWVWGMLCFLRWFDIAWSIICFGLFGGFWGIVRGLGC